MKAHPLTFFFFFFLSAPQDSWDLSSPTRGEAHIQDSESVES